LREPLSAGEAVALLRRDVTREVRHHLVGQLRQVASERLGERLVWLYHQVRSSEQVGSADRLTVCNLLVYLISRTSDDAMSQLAGLLVDEDDSFLLSAVLWALCHLGSDSALARFFELLQSDDEFRACSRGYVLYYYGDFRSAKPPFLDLPPYVAHERTSTRVPAMFASAGFGDVPVQRRYVDIYTFLDVHLVRGSEVSSRVSSILRATVDAVLQEGGPPTVKDQLLDMYRTNLDRGS
jgi:hypothetical protein